MSRTKWFIVFFFVFALLGYCREFFFVNLNLILFETYYNSVSSVPIPSIMNVFRNSSYETLYYSKYIYTFLWTVLFFAVNYFALRKLTANPYLIKLLWYAYLLMLGLAFVLMIYGYFVNNRLQDDEYTLSRWLMGIAQSPIICLILAASEKLYNKSFQS